MQEIKAENGDLIAIVVKDNFGEEYGVNFISDEEFPLQLGISLYKKGDRILAHHHIDRERVIHKIQEYIYIKKGRVSVDLYDPDNKKITDVELSEGDSIFFVDGGHGFDIIEESKIIEIKQGPYFGKDQDKKVIE